MIPWLLVATKWIRSVLGKLPASWYIAAFLVAALIGQQVYWKGALALERGRHNRERSELVQRLDRQQQELDELRGAVEAARNLKPGESREVRVPFPVPGATKLIPGPTQYVPVFISRTETQVIAKTPAVTLPPEVIERLVEVAPSSITLNFMASRDIKAGERFQAHAFQVGPGMWQLVLPAGSPVEGGITSRTAPPKDDRWTWRAYIGASVRDGVVAGGEVEYRLDQGRYVRGRVECQHLLSRSGVRCDEWDARIEFGQSW